MEFKWQNIQWRVRGLELDIWRRTNPNFQPYEKIDESYFQVGHDSPNKGNLKKWLQDIYDWHLGNLNHDVVLITLDIKSTDGSFNPFPAEIDTYLDNYFYFGANIIFKPKDLIGESTISLFSYVKDNGWPTLEK